MTRPPQQQRSIESTRRMLDAAEHLMREGGSDALTVEQVIARAGTSVGSFYARFGSRQGLLEAMHERFLTGFITGMADVLTDPPEQPSLAPALEAFVRALFTTVRTHRDTVAFYVLHNAHDPAMRAEGNAMTQAMTAQLADLLRRHPDEVALADLEANVDLSSRLLFGFCLQMLIFDDDEITGSPLDLDGWVTATTRLLVGIAATEATGAVPEG